MPPAAGVSSAGPSGEPTVISLAAPPKVIVSVPLGWPGAGNVWLLVITRASAPPGTPAGTTRALRPSWPRNWLSLPAPCRRGAGTDWPSAWTPSPSMVTA